MNECRVTFQSQGHPWNQIFPEPKFYLTPALKLKNKNPRWGSYLLLMRRCAVLMGLLAFPLWWLKWFFSLCHQPQLICPRFHSEIIRVFCSACAVNPTLPSAWDFRNRKQTPACDGENWNCMLYKLCCRWSSMLKTLKAQHREMQQQRLS